MEELQLCLLIIVYHYNHTMHTNTELKMGGIENGDSTDILAVKSPDLLSFFHFFFPIIWSTFTICELIVRILDFRLIRFEPVHEKTNNLGF